MKTKSTCFGMSRKAAVRGDYAADTLGSLQTKRPPAANKNGWFRRLPDDVHVHAWLFGTDNKVCSLCGLTLPKSTP